MKVKAVGIFISLISTAFCLVAIYSRINPSIIILNNYGAGRLGDQIIGYTKAKWLSYKYNIPFRLIPFAHTEKLMIGQEQSYTNWSYFLSRVFYKIFGRIVWVHTEQDLIDALKTLDRPTRFIAHINTRLLEHMQAEVGTDRYDTAWVGSVLYELTIQNSEFGNYLKNMLQPVTESKKMQLPKDRITVAVHIRKGGTYDSQPTSQQYFDHNHNVHYEQFYMNTKNINLSQAMLKNIPIAAYDLAHRESSDRIYGDKFPPEQYYVDQIMYLAHRYNNAPLYVHIFTDDTKPKELTKRIETKVNNPAVIFACNTDSHVLEDWVAMGDFDCLIRSGSLFPYTAQLAGHNKIILYPLHVQWIDNNRLVVDKIGVIIRDKEFGVDT